MWSKERTTLVRAMLHGGSTWREIRDEINLRDRAKTVLRYREALAHYYPGDVYTPPTLASCPVAFEGNIPVVVDVYCCLKTGKTVTVYDTRTASGVQESPWYD